MNRSNDHLTYDSHHLKQRVKKSNDERNEKRQTENCVETERLNIHRSLLLCFSFTFHTYAKRVAQKDKFAWWIPFEKKSNRLTHIYGIVRREWKKMKQTNNTEPNETYHEQINDRFTDCIYRSFLFMCFFVSFLDYNAWYGYTFHLEVLYFQLNQCCSAALLCFLLLSTLDHRKTSFLSQLLYEWIHSTTASKFRVDTICSRLRIFLQKYTKAMRMSYCFCLWGNYI